MDKIISEFIHLYTYSELRHGIRVAEMSNELMFYIGLKDKKRKSIYTGAVLHDIGKYFVDNEIINKPGKLNVRERLLVQDHVVYAYDLLKKRDVSKDILETVLYHHENYDGSGYPSTLRGKDIPVGARIVRICDTYDAITNDRPYQKSKTIEEALDIMEAVKEYYDPLLFGFFKDIIVTKYEYLHKSKGL